MGRTLLTLSLVLAALSHSANAADPQLEWSLFRGTAERDTGKATAVDRWGNVRTVGSTTGAFPGYRNEGKADGFVASYDHEPSRSFSAVQWGDGNSNSPVSVAVDPLGYIHVVGSNQSPSPSIGFYRKIGPLGRLCPEKPIRIEDRTGCQACISDGCFGVVVAGWASKGTNSFCFVRRYDRFGRELWTEYLADEPDERARVVGLALHPSGDVLVSGYAFHRLDDEATDGTRDGFVARLACKSGKKHWIRRSKHPGPDYSFGVCADRKGRIFVAGNFWKSDMPFEQRQEEAIDTDLPSVLEDELLATGYSWKIDVIHDRDGSHIDEIKPGYAGAARDLVIARDGTLMIAGTRLFVRLDPVTKAVSWELKHGSNYPSVTRDNSDGVYLTGWAQKHRNQTASGPYDFFVDKYLVP